MAGRFSIAILTFLLASSLLWGRCLSCRTLAAQQPVHDCCNQGSCHRDSGAPPASLACPHQAPALQNFAKVEPVSPVAVLAAVPLEASSSLSPLPVLPVAVAAAPLLVHSPPDLFLRNAVLLI